MCGVEREWILVAELDSDSSLLLLGGTHSEPKLPHLSHWCQQAALHRVLERAKEIVCSKCLAHNEHTGQFSPLPPAFSQ